MVYFFTKKKIKFSKQKRSKMGINRKKEAFKYSD